MFNRKLSEFGVHPLIAYFLLLLVFTGLSEFLFYFTPYAPYVYMLIALYFTSKLSEIKRNDFLKICFGNGLHRKIRIMENLTMILPFVIFLIYKQDFQSIIILMTIAVLTALFNFKTTCHIIIPTPFFKRPFEFTVGFRNTFFLFLIAYILTTVAIVVDNVNLGIFSSMLIFLTVLCFYLIPENEYFVWSYSCTPANFLIEKIKTAFIFTFCLCLPVLLLLGIFYVEYIGILLVCNLLGYAYLTCVILAKYAAYPGEIDLGQAILLGLTFIFPPLLIAVIPFFANQSANKLKHFLP